ncbi:hypothetical protein KP509_02G023600 [Ceratopteris richardii]|uniref:DNA helicase n=1 Tax=Ceratopteris richardii TaxID=49495 RepID=A0A8T2VB38_CERRI|nr:hypothetical protein KP509_02G023600 [Ceratopteris richardii]
MELLDHDQELALALFSDADAFATELMDRILDLLSVDRLRRRYGDCNRNSPLVNVRSARGSRLWIRFTSIPLPLLPVNALKHLSFEITSNAGKITHCPNFGQLVYVYGVVYAISNIRKKLFRQRFICKICKSIYDSYYGCELSLPSGCCTTWIREDIESHDYLPYQEILLGPVPNMTSGGLEIAAKGSFCSRLITVYLFDDLTGRVALGDSVALIGHAKMHCDSSAAISSLSPSSYWFSNPRIKANNIFVPFNLNSLKVSSNQSRTDTFRGKDGKISLEMLCKELCNHGPPSTLWPRLFPIAVLLSLVATNYSCDTYEHPPAASSYPLLDGPLGKRKGITARKQIHILVTTRGFSSDNTLKCLQAASTYASRCMYDAAGKCRYVAQVKHEDEAKENQMVHADCLALSKGGLLILDLSFITAAKKNNLCDAMDRCGSKLQQKKVVNVYGTTTIWALSQESSQKTGIRPAKQRACLQDQSLLRRFDIVFEEPLGLLAESDLVQTLIMDLNESLKSSTSSSELQQHLLTASRIASVRITDKAHRLLCSYYLALRRDKESGDCSTESADDASILTLESLLRVAEACAKLCLSSEIREIPHATLAIMLCENTYLTKVIQKYNEH